MKRRERENEDSLPLRNLAHPFLKALRKMCKLMEIVLIIFSFAILGCKWLICLQCGTCGKAKQKRRKTN